MSSSRTATGVGGRHARAGPRPSCFSPSRRRCWAPSHSSRSTRPRRAASSACGSTLVLTGGDWYGTARPRAGSPSSRCSSSASGTLCSPTWDSATLMPSPKPAPGRRRPRRAPRRQSRLC
ncbi:hypothetical protein VHUM_00988 [Vanrija humicola]|uniref:Uncharacterized protein n=1 Tax=Vanrija humicola TaxID=5417 RepID=A0A7D8V9L8_VANHU|nr:hypothetical protein VHUM_00988 [Vanrija humicola]